LRQQTRRSTQNVGTRRQAIFGIGAAAAAIGLALTLLALPAFGGSAKSQRTRMKMPDVSWALMHRLVSGHTSTGEYASLWQAPTTDGGRCVFLRFAKDPLAVPRAGYDGGACSPAGAAYRDPIAVAVHWLPAAQKGFQVLLTGLHAEPEITQLELKSGASSSPLVFERGHFIGELPSVPSAGELPAGSGPYIVVGYDSAGNEVASVNVNAQIAAMAAPS
jgi:hypothetical protein